MSVDVSKTKTRFKPNDLLKHWVISSSLFCLPPPMFFYFGTPKLRNEFTFQSSNRKQFVWIQLDIFPRPSPVRLFSIVPPRAWMFDGPRNPLVVFFFSFFSLFVCKYKPYALVYLLGFSLFSPFQFSLKCRHRKKKPEISRCGRWCMKQTLKKSFKILTCNPHCFLRIDNPDACPSLFSYRSKSWQSRILCMFLCQWTDFGW